MHPVHEACGGADALVKLETGNWQVLYLDRRLPDLDAEELIEVIRRRFPGIQVVLVDSDTGAPGSGRFGSSCEAGIPMVAAGVDGDRPHVEPLPRMVGNSPAMHNVYQLVRLIAPRKTTVLILGASGTGKELIARALHQLSPRANRPFVVVNCAAIPEALLESELFGYARGAFTGAVQSHLGRIQSAAGGTLFLDEIGDMPSGLQAKLLRFLEQKEVQRLGSAETVQVDVRVVAATNVNLLDRIEQGGFREDLFYRLAAFPIELPALNARLEDLSVLAEYFLTSQCGPGKQSARRLSPRALATLTAHSWRGNVRELQQVLERAEILAGDALVLEPEHLSFPFLSGFSPSSPPQQRHFGELQRQRDAAKMMS